MPFALSREISSCMRKGKQVPDAAIVQALQHRLASPDVLMRGWVMDDFPLTTAQAKTLTEAGIVPHKLLVVNVPEDLVFTRALQLSKESSANDPDLVQREVVLQRHRLDGYARQSPLLRSYYGLTYDNVCEIDGTKSAWAMYDRALQETTAAIACRSEYYRRTNNGMAARIHGMCYSPKQLEADESEYKEFCPVTLTLSNELVPRKDKRCAVEYKSKIYQLASEEKAKLFLDDPESFLQVPLPKDTPTAISFSSRRTCLAPELDGYCPVALVDRKAIVRSIGSYIVKFQNKTWSFENKEARDKFMRRPMRYVARASLPSKKPALSGSQNIALLASLTKGKGLEASDMLTYMQASVAEVISQSLVESAAKRPLYPGKSAQESALLFLARFLRSRNPLNTDMYHAEVRKQLDSFISDCALPKEVAQWTERKRSCEASGAKLDDSFVPGDLAQDVWTASDTMRYEELCARFDKVFSLKL
eukprot:gnl/TRDRNA2_/TRDRNA2_168837_c1_seq1.p1 gnl/TRDRNA2_/TRDRNA2_168837_c1~~gnl/TRDRNA2_/TRDRNA2_168837_c1_seq1.p1  ORF type:complete len:493 (-),score=97.15 gnl/TRDRNA2_/TRDRNA2_168837_c1_seq1:122-1549(-)